LSYNRHQQENTGYSYALSTGFLNSHWGCRPRGYGVDADGLAGDNAEVGSVHGRGASVWRAFHAAGRRGDRQKPTLASKIHFEKAFEIDYRSW